MTKKVIKDMNVKIDEIHIIGKSNTQKIERKHHLYTDFQQRCKAQSIGPQAFITTPHNQGYYQQTDISACYNPSCNKNAQSRWLQ